VHFIGIGGVGMSGIAEVLSNLGYSVSGSDERRSSATDRLASLGIRVTIGHGEEAVGDSDVVVVSSAVKPSNPEVAEARRRQIPVIPRAEMLAELMRLRFGIAVAGAHGKTTTTSMVAFMLERAGLDPTAVIGGRLRAFGSNARLGHSDLMVAEADESDRSFLKLCPTLAVITNIDHEHLENYRGFDDLLQAFTDFANSVPFYGAVVACGDDEGLARVIPRLTRRVTTYGLTRDSSDVTGTEVVFGRLSVEAMVRRRPHRSSRASGVLEPLGLLRLAIPGRHNLQNALAAVTVGLELDLPFEQIASALAEFRGVERRFDIRGEPSGVLIVDDYGHHPNEIRAVLEAARGLERRLVVAFQPHRYSRTAALMEQFGPALAAADHVILGDIYAAGEEPLPGVTVEALERAIRRDIAVPVEVARTIDDVVARVVATCRPGDVVLTLGAGSISSVPDRLMRILGELAAGSHGDAS
jgi:UDP-N-acetylmuramate--alanine ligase